MFVKGRVIVVGNVKGIQCQQKEKEKQLHDVKLHQSVKLQSESQLSERQLDESDDKRNRPFKNKTPKYAGFCFCDRIAL